MRQILSWLRWLWRIPPAGLHRGRRPSRRAQIRAYDAELDNLEREITRRPWLAALDPGELPHYWEFPHTGGKDVPTALREADRWLAVHRRIIGQSATTNLQREPDDPYDPELDPPYTVIDTLGQLAAGYEPIDPLEGPCYYLAGCQHRCSGFCLGAEANPTDNPTPPGSGYPLRRPWLDDTEAFTAIRAELAALRDEIDSWTVLPIGALS